MDCANARITATDADLAQVAAAKGFLKGVADEVGAADATELPFASGHTDLVVAMNLFHHVTDWRRALAETHRVLRPGGRLVVAGITDRGLGGGAFLRFVAPRSTYSRQAFMDAARDAGFRTVHDHGSERYIRAILEKA